MGGSGVNDNVRGLGEESREENERGKGGRGMKEARRRSGGGGGGVGGKTRAPDRHNKLHRGRISTNTKHTYYSVLYIR